METSPPASANLNAIRLGRAWGNIDCCTDATPCPLHHCGLISAWWHVPRAVYCNPAHWHLSAPRVHQSHALALVIAGRCPQGGRQASFCRGGGH
eukprot:1414888-Alexandrium_andersonii.AAC.1